MSKPRVLLLLGASATGKTTAARTLHRQGWRHIEASEVLRGLAARHAIGGADQMSTAERLFEKVGFDAVARAVVSELRSDTTEKVVLSGLRTPEELLMIFKAPLSVRVVTLHTSFQLRARRVEENEDSLMRRDEEEFSWGLLPIVDDFADRIVVNEGTLSEFTAAIESPEILEDRRVSMPSEVAVRRCSALAEIESGSRPSDLNLSKLTEPPGLARHQPNGRWVQLRPGRVYVELSRIRWGDSCNARLPSVG